MFITLNLMHANTTRMWGGEDEGRGKIFLWDTVKGYFFSHFYKFIMLKKLVTLFKDF